MISPAHLRSGLVATAALSLTLLGCSSSNTTPAPGSDGGRRETGAQKGDGGHTGSADGGTGHSHEGGRGDARSDACTSAGYAPTVLGLTGLVSYYRLDETTGTSAKDDKGGNTGAYTSATLGQPSLLASDADDAVGLNGASAFVEVPDAPSLHLTAAMTLAAIVKPSAVTGKHQILAKEGAYWLQVVAGGLELAFVDGGGTVHALEVASGVNLNAVSYIVGTYDGATLKAYINGALVGSQAETATIASGTSDLRLGSWDGQSYYFGGVLDEAFVGAGAITAADVAALYAAGTGCGSPPITDGGAPSDAKAGKPDATGHDGSTREAGALYEGKLLGMNCSFGDLPADQTNVLTELGVNSVRGDIELSGTAFQDPSYDGTVENWVDVLTTNKIVPLPLLNQYVEMSTINVQDFVSATVTWCQAYCAGGTFYQGNASANAYYAPQVLEILNEPYGNWWGYDVNASDIAAYATLLTAIRTGLDNAGLSNIAILAAANDNNGGTANWDTDLLANGAFATVQGVTVHPYGDVDLSMDTSGTDTNGWGLVYYVHTLLTQASLAAANRIYATEDGWCTGMGGDCAPGGVSYTEMQKDQNIATVISQLATVSWLEGFWYFNLHPYGGNSFGLYGADGGMTPAWGAFQTAAESNGF